MLVSTRLERFVNKKNNVWNCRCPLCGDSKRNKTKSRGYFYPKKTNIFYCCKNCGVSISLGTFLKQVDPTLSSEYRFEYYKEGNHSNVPKPEFAKVGEQVKQVDLGLQSIDKLPESHIARQYVSSRKIPKQHWSYLYYTPEFKSFVQEVMVDSKKDVTKWKDHDARLVIPYYDRDKNLLGVQGRALSESKVRYITVKACDEALKIYGLDRVNLSKKVYVVEGPLDSLFLDNSVATMDSSLESVKDIVGDYEYVFIYDNQPRNKDLIKQMRKSVIKGYSVCVWPSDIEHKDINDMVQEGGMTPSEVQHIIDKNTYSGLRAQLEFEKWKKVET